MESFGLLAFVLMLVTGIVCRMYLCRLLGLPYTVVLMALGMGTGMILAVHDKSPTLRSWYNIDPEVLLYTFIPILVFESAFSTDTHIFNQQKWQILSLAGPGVLIASILTGLFVYYAFDDYSWSWPVCLMFGAMLSATDPVAVVALLKELGVSERLAVLIEGESLLNDGTAIVVFDVFRHALVHRPCDPEMPTFMEVFEMLFRLGGLGPIVGCMVGSCCIHLLRHTVNDALNETTITLLAAYASFGIAEGIVGTSGVLSVVFCGLFVSRYGKGAISANVEHSLHSFWAMLAHVANTAIFFVAGLIVAVKSFGLKHRDLGDDCVKCGDHHHSSESSHDDTHEYYFLYTAESEQRKLSGYKAEDHTDCYSFRFRDVLYLGALYITLHVVRSLVVFLSYPILNRSTYGFSPAQALVLSYGGLRGAVGLALALIISEEEDIESKLQMRILFHVSGIAVLTLCVNGTTTASLLKALGMDRSTHAEERIFDKLVMKIEKHLAHEMDEVAMTEPQLAHADWHAVWRYLPVLSLDAYWLRVKHERVILNTAERNDLHALHFAQKQHIAKLRLHGREYPVPPALRQKWVAYHRAFGGSVPRFAVKLHKAGESDKKTQSLDDVLDLVDRAAIAHMEHDELEAENALIPRATSTHRAHRGIIVEQQRARPKSLSQDRRVSLVAAVAEASNDPRIERYKAVKRHSIEEGSSDENKTETTVSPMFQSLAQFKRATGETSLEDDDEDEDEKSKPKNEEEAKRRVELLEGLSHVPVSKQLSMISLSGFSSGEIDEERDVLSEARSRCLWALRSSYQHSFASGKLSESGLRLLIENVDEQSDDTSRALDGWERLRSADFTRPPKVLTSILDMVQNATSKLPILTSLRSALAGFVFRKTAFLFEVAYNFVRAHESVEATAFSGGDIAVCRSLNQELQVQIDLAQNAIAAFVQASPEAGNSVATQMVARYMLVRMQEHFEHVHHTGALSEKEAEHAEAEINTARLLLDSHPYAEALPPLEKLIHHVPFLSFMPEADVRDLVRDRALCHPELLPAGKILARQGESRLERRAGLGRYGWYVVVRGTVLVKWSVNEKDTNSSTVLTAGDVLCLEEQLLDLPFLATYQTKSMCTLAFFDRKLVHAKARDDAALRRGLYWQVALGAIGDFPVFDSLTGRDLAALGRSADFVEGPDNSRVFAKLLAQQRSIRGTAQHTAAKAAKKNMKKKSSATNLDTLDEASAADDLESTPSSGSSVTVAMPPEKRSNANESIVVALPADSAMLLLQGSVSTFALDANLDEVSTEPLRIYHAIDLIHIDEENELPHVRIAGNGKAFIFPRDPAVETRGVIHDNQFDLSAALVNEDHVGTAGTGQLNGSD